MAQRTLVLPTLDEVNAIKDDVTALNGKSSYCYGWRGSHSDLLATSGTGTAETAIWQSSSSSIQMPPGKYLVMLSIPYSTSANTAGCKLYLGNTLLVAGATNQKTSNGFTRVSVAQIVTVSETLSGRISIKLYGQDSNTTWTYANYNNVFYFIIRL